MKIAVEGCAHGELEKIYDVLQSIEKTQNIKIDLLICCGDFQATRNYEDLRCMAVPPKYQSMCSFYKYYAGEKVAPILTIFIGGNHEASNYLQELAYGGWVAPNIYYLGYASVINVAGIRIGGLSGIYKGHDYMKGHFEKPPYSEETKRSVYHIRNLEVFRLKQIKEPVDIILSHDWPRGIYRYGNKEQLLKYKPYFKNDMDNDTLGSKPCEELLQLLQPKFWFSAHMHVKFAAIVTHTQDQSSDSPKKTKFLALDKCLPKRKFLQVIDIPHDTSKAIELEYDLEWLTILHLTNHLLSVKKSLQYMPGPGSNGRWVFTPTAEEMEFVRKKFRGNLVIPLNFTQTAQAFCPNQTTNSPKPHRQAQPQINPQTMVFCDQLSIDDPMALLLNLNDSSLNLSQTRVSSLPSFLTPEKPGEVTRVSFNDSSPDAIIEDEFSDDDNSKRSMSGHSNLLDICSPVQSERTRLSLPMPVNNEREDRSVSNVSSGHVGRKEYPVAKRNSEGELKTVEGACDKTTNECSSEIKTPRTFKRRNQSIYSGEISS